MRKLIAVVVVLALVLVGADVAGRLIAEQKAGEALAGQVDGAAEPTVDIHGFSFLIQAVGGSYSHITIAADDLTLGPVDGATMHADLYGVQFPLSDALSGSLDNLAADRAHVRAVIPGEALAAALHQPGLTFSAAPGDALRVHTTIAAAGRTFPVTVDLDVTVTDDRIDLRARPISAVGVSIPVQATAALQDRLSLSIPLTVLPVPLSSATVTATDGDLVVAAEMRDVDMSELASG